MDATEEALASEPKASDPFAAMPKGLLFLNHLLLASSRIVSLFLNVFISVVGSLSFLLASMLS